MGQKRLKILDDSKRKGDYGDLNNAAENPNKWTARTGRSRSGEGGGA